MATNVYKAYHTDDVKDQDHIMRQNTYGRAIPIINTTFLSQLFSSGQHCLSLITLDQL